MQSQKLKRKNGINFGKNKIMLYSPRIPNPPPISDIRKVKTSYMKDESAVEFCERVYPEMMDEFKKVQTEMYETFCKKQRNYGPSNISVGTSLQTKGRLRIILHLL